MKTDRNILIAFILNAVFSVVEFIGGIFTGSVAILSDAVHDLGDSISIGFAYFLEKISKKTPDKTHTYGYLRYSVLGGLITTFILLIGSVFVIYNAIVRILNPVEINYDGMIIFAIAGTVINFVASYFTTGGHSLNQRSVNLHMLEDMLGWIVVLVGALIMKFTDITYIDPIMSIGVALFIFVNAYKNLLSIANLFLEKTPDGVSIDELTEHLLKIKGVEDIHHFHIRSIDNFNNIATLHAIVDGDVIAVKNEIKNELKEHGINHITVETELPGEECCDLHCHIEGTKNEGCSNHHHHH